MLWRKIKSEDTSSLKWMGFFFVAQLSKNESRGDIGPENYLALPVRVQVTPIIPLKLSPQLP